MVTPPKGWSNHPSDLDEYWSTDDSQGSLIAQAYGIDSPVGLMYSTEISDALHLFTSGQTYYLWNEADDTVWKITSPADLKGIVQVIDTEHVLALEFQELERIA
ncbi:hypothetical protein BDV39DRAFT_168800 [Aspergillus sergii]|uniref:Uncharacterized protein n=1 Tax=Aspergillus sergii TaxID=1034303 RepID=A0A5N6XH93_9EURO|nr:hypothetical protein BDV39DRAFT_168800 [Aspergillus sergii]